jgi:hypothetical protein
MESDDFPITWNKCTPVIQDKLLYALSKGAPYKLSCDYAGITFGTFNNWRKKADDGDPAFTEFFERVRKIKGKAAINWLDKIDQAMEEGQWQAAAWKLERRYFRYFGKSSDVMELAKKMDRIEKEIKDSAKRNDQNDD